MAITLKIGAAAQEEMPQEEKDTVEEFIDIDMEGEDV